MPPLLTSLVAAASGALLVASVLPGCCTSESTQPATAEETQAPRPSLPDAQDLKSTSIDCMMCGAFFNRPRSPEEVTAQMETCKELQNSPGVCAGCPVLEEVCRGEKYTLENVESPSPDQYWRRRADELLGKIVKCYGGAYTRQTYLAAEQTLMGDLSKDLRAVVEYRRRVERKRCKI